jgi:hypothetical protein
LFELLSKCSERARNTQNESNGSAGNNKFIHKKRSSKKVEMELYRQNINMNAAIYKDKMKGVRKYNDVQMI